jgi:cysteine desulfurase / selenocysteine lyase
VGEVMNYKLNESGYRDIIVGVETKVPLSNGELVNAINFDNAATTPPFIEVMQEINRFAPWYSSVHRGAGYKSQLSSSIFEKSRLKVLDFVNADRGKYTVIYVKNATEAINKLSNILCQDNEKKVILSTDMEHHSNDLPWRRKYKVDYISVDNNGRLLLNDLEKKLNKYKGKVKLVTVAGASNVTGYINPIYTIAEISHRYDAKVLVDGAQLVPHMPVDIRPSNPLMHIDYLVFSAHKMYAPFGVGALVAPKDIFERGCPDCVGGGTVKLVTHEFVKWDVPPHKEEAGTPNLFGVVALASAIKVLNTIGMNNVKKYENYLTEYALEGIRSIPGIELYGGIDGKGRVGIIPFNIIGMDHDMTASILSGEAGIAVRDGCFCAQPYVQRMLNIHPEEVKKYINLPDNERPGMVRISFGLYNSVREIDILLYTLKKILNNKEYYIKKYRV